MGMRVNRHSTCPGEAMGLGVYRNLREVDYGELRFGMVL